MKKKKQKTESSKRYYGLITASVVMLLLVITSLGLDIYGSSKLYKNDSMLTAATSVQSSLEQMKHRLVNSRIALRDYGKLIDLQNSVDSSRKTGETAIKTVDALVDGGEVLDSEGNPTHIPPAPLGREHLSKIQTTLTKLNLTLEKMKFTTTASGTVSNPMPYDKVVANVQRLTEEAMGSANTLVSELKLLNVHQTKRIMMLQILGLILTILYFLVFMFFFMRQLLNIDRTAEKTHTEIEEIMSTVNEGLFLINQDLKISEQYSTRLEELLGQTHIAGRKLDDILKPIVSKKDLDTTVEFIDQLYNSRVKEKLIQDLNPLDYLEVQLTDENGNFFNRFLSFNFSRVYEGKTIKRVLVSIRDISDAVLLEQQLTRQQEQSSQQIELLTSIMHADPHMLRTFVNHAYHSTERINEILKRSGSEHADLHVKTQDIFREVHSLKGEASALDLDEFVALTHKFEDSIAALQAKKKLTGNDFLPLAVSLEKIIEQLDRVDTLIKHFSKITEAYHKNNQGQGEKSNASTESAQAKAASTYSSNNTDALSSYYSKYVNNVASRNGKSVLLETKGLEALSEDKRLSEKLSDIIVQLIRNAVVHGIEIPEQRKAAGKSQHGTIRVSFARSLKENKAELIIGDDGAGINYEGVRKQLVDISLCDQKTANNLSKRQLIALLFDSGFSTIANVNEDAGRGVGLDIIKERVETLKGRIKVDTKEGHHTRFIIHIPLRMG
ncbi:MAG: hypothetical protein CR974_03805 [Gammaproteobacteria bacterium]|nr:MAG: hypothetical protein CR974_03805 [Gammaproteobacteria bacterium]